MVVREQDLGDSTIERREMQRTKVSIDCNVMVEVETGNYRGLINKELTSAAFPFIKNDEIMV